MKLFSKEDKRYISENILYRIVSLSIAAGSLSIPTIAIAQRNSIGDQIGAHLQKAMEEVMSRRITVSPTSITFTPQTKTATLEFSNTTKDTLEADVMVALSVPSLHDQAGDAPQEKKKRGRASGGGFKISGFPAGSGTEAPAPQPTAPPNTESPKAAAKNDSIIDSTKSAVKWIKGLPAKIRLAPGEGKKISVTLEVPPSATQGEYAAWIFASTEMLSESKNTTEKKGAENSSIGTSMRMPLRPDGKPFRLVSATKVTYRVP